MSDQSQTTVQAAVSLVVYRRQLLADAKKERASMQRLVRRCESALDDAEEQLTTAIVKAGRTPQREVKDILADYGVQK